MEIHFPHLANEIPTTPKKRRLNTLERLLTATIAFVMCSAVVFLSACNVGGGGY